MKASVRSAVIDGEGVICGRDGKSDFDRVRACFSRYGAPEAFLDAFDVLSSSRPAWRSDPAMVLRTERTSPVQLKPPDLSCAEFT